MSELGAGDPRPQRCAVATRRRQVEPTGTAVAPAGFLLVTWPRPWPRDASSVPELAPTVSLITRLARQGCRHRLQLVDGPARDDDRVEVIHYRRSTSGYRGFHRRHATCDPDHVATTCGRMLEDPEFGRAGASEEIGHAVKDVLICTHGSRDVCCGSGGTKLFESLAGDPRLAVTAVNIWRTSHLGGHRFAPTALTFPDGQHWGYLQPEDVLDIVERNPDLSRLQGKYRGSAGFADPAVQVLEAEAFRMHGWSWLDAVRDASHRRSPGREENEVAAIVSHSWPDGTGGTTSARVRRGEALLVPACRSASAPPTIDHRWSVADLETTATRESNPGHGSTSG